MKRAMIVLSIMVLLLPINIYAYNNSKAYDWFKNTDMIVTDSNRQKYIDEYGLTGITNGTFLLNYNMRNKSILLNNPNLIKDLSISSSFSALILLNGYTETNDPALLERAILIGDNILDNKVLKRPFVYGGRELTVIAPQTQMINGTWQMNSNFLEAYPNDLLVNAAFLIELSHITNDNKYATVGLEVIDSMIYLQESLVDFFKGGLPYFLYTDGDVFRPKWNISLDIAYQVFIAANVAYSYTSNDKYKTFENNYFDMIYNMLDRGIYNTFTKNGKEYILPFEHIVQDENTSNYYGVNHNNYLETEFSPETDITMDQFFYFTLGIANHDPDNTWAKKFYDTAKVLMNDNYFYWGEYTIDGKKGTADGTELEIVNTAFMIELMKTMGETKDKYRPLQCALIHAVEESDDKSINGAWTWSVGIDDLIEGLATSWIILEVYDKNGSENCCPLPNDTVVEEPKDVVEEKKDVPSKVEENPQTGVFSLIPIFLVIATISTTLYLYINKKKIFKKM